MVLLRIFIRSSIYCRKSFTRNYSMNSTRNLINFNVDNQTGYALVELNRLPVNNLNLEILDELNQILDNLERNQSKGMILTSSSSKVFCAGVDLMELYNPNEQRLHEFWSKLQDVWLKLFSSSYPTVAVINGHAPGFGSILAACCEYRVMCPNSTIGMIATKIGIVPPFWFISPFQNILTPRNVELALIQGRMFDTHEALKLGLVDEVVTDKDEGILKSREFLERFQKIPSSARAITKRELRGDAIKLLEENRKSDTEKFIKHIKSAGMQESLGQYIEELKNKK